MHIERAIVLSSQVLIVRGIPVASVASVSIGVELIGCIGRQKQLVEEVYSLGRESVISVTSSRRSMRSRVMTRTLDLKV